MVWVYAPTPSHTVTMGFSSQELRGGQIRRNVSPVNGIYIVLQLSTRMVCSTCLKVIASQRSTDF